MTIALGSAACPHLDENTKKGKSGCGVGHQIEDGDLVPANHLLLDLYSLVVQLAPHLLICNAHIRQSIG